MADDIYNGYLIPKGSLVVANGWYANPCASDFMAAAHYV